MIEKFSRESFDELLTIRHGQFFIVKLLHYNYGIICTVYSQNILRAKIFRGLANIISL